eukprot:34472_1
MKTSMLLPNGTFLQLNSVHFTMIGSIMLQLAGSFRKFMKFHCVIDKKTKEMIYDHHMQIKHGNDALVCRNKKEIISGVSTITNINGGELGRKTTMLNQLTKQKEDKIGLIGHAQKCGIESVWIKTSVIPDPASKANFVASIDHVHDGKDYRIINGVPSGNSTNKCFLKQLIPSFNYNTFSAIRKFY